MRDGQTQLSTFQDQSAPPYPYPPNSPGMSAPPLPGYPLPQYDGQNQPFIPENPEENHDPSHLPHDAELPSYEWATSKLIFNSILLYKFINYKAIIKIRYGASFRPLSWGSRTP